MISIFRFSLFVLLIASPLAAQDSLTQANWYLFSYFKGNGEDGLHLAYSKNGFHWTALKNDSSFLVPLVGKEKLMRDPSIILGNDGYYHMVWTVGWKGQGIGYARSKDLIDWSPQQYLPVMEHEPNAQNSWAPEVFFNADNNEYIIFWSTGIPGRFADTDNQSDAGPPAPGRNHRVYCTTTKDFKNFSPTRLFYDHGFNVIDPVIVKDNGEYIMFLKDETNKPFTPQKNIRIATSKKAEGPYSLPGEPITGKYWAEGPTAIKIQEQWMVYFDKYKLRKYGLIISRDLKHWVDASDALIYPEGMRHGTVLEVHESIIRNLLKQ